MFAWVGVIPIGICSGQYVYRYDRMDKTNYSTNFWGEQYKEFIRKEEKIHRKIETWNKVYDQTVIHQTLQLACKNLCFDF